MRPRLWLADVRSADGLELVFNAEFDDTRRPVSVLMRSGRSHLLAAHFPHVLREAGETLGDPEADAEVRRRAESLALVLSTGAVRARGSA